MHKTIRHLLMLCAAALAAASCSTTYKNINYIQDALPDETEQMTISKGILIQPKDMISIVVSSRNPELAQIFNLPRVTYQIASGTSSTGSGSGSSNGIMGYSVDNDGNIDFPVLGTIHVAGMTRWELAKMIKKMLISQDLLKDAVVTVEFMSFKVSVIGEVNSPGTYDIQGDKITLLEALSMAGDLTIFGKRDNVTVIREQNGERIFYKVDLRSIDLFDSPAYNLQQNDVVYVEPNKVRAGQSTINENNLKSVSLWISIASFLTTIATLIVALSGK